MDWRVELALWILAIGVPLLGFIALKNSYDARYHAGRGDHYQDLAQKLDQEADDLHQGLQRVAQERAQYRGFIGMLMFYFIEKDIDSQPRNGQRQLRRKRSDFDDAEIED